MGIVIVDGSMEINLKEAECVNWYWICAAVGRVWWRTFVKVVMNLWFPQM
jgi:hypothetical protein